MVCEMASILSRPQCVNSQVAISQHMDKKTKLIRDQEAHCMCTKFEESILIHEAMIAKQGHSCVPLDQSHPGLPW